MYDFATPLNATKRADEGLPLSVGPCPLTGYGLVQMVLMHDWQEGNFIASDCFL